MGILQLLAFLFPLLVCHQTILGTGCTLCRGVQSSVQGGIDTSSNLVPSPAVNLPGCQHLPP